MPITQIIKGDLLLSDEKNIAHGVNCLGVMEGGIALQIKEMYPTVYNEYLGFIQQNAANSLMGAVQRVRLDKDLNVYNIFTQFSYTPSTHETRLLSYGALIRGFSKLNQRLAASSNPRIAIPKIGAGIGGGDWSVIEEVINAVTPNIEVVVYELDFF